jgi:hypothetical protein
MTIATRSSALPVLYRTTEPWVRRGLGALKGAFDGMWLGLLDPTHLDALDAQYYDAKTMYVDDGYNVGGLHAWERAAIEEYFPAAGRIVVTGAGGGREVLALLELGFDAVGFECNRRLASYGDALLRRHGHDGRLHWAPRHEWPSQSGGCDGVVVGWGSYTHMPGRALRLRFLRGARAHLRPGSPVLLSFWSVRSLTTYLRAVEIVGTAIRRLCGRPGLDAGDALAGTYVHFFTEHQVRAELFDAGFAPVEYRDNEYAMAIGAARDPGQTLDEEDR